MWGILIIVLSLRSPSLLDTWNFMRAKKFYSLSPAAGGLLAGGPTPLDAWCLSLLMLAACRLTLDTSLIFRFYSIGVEVRQPGLCYDWFSHLVFTIWYIRNFFIPAISTIFAFIALWRGWTGPASCHDWRCPGPAFWGWPIYFRSRQSYNKIRRYYGRI